MLTRSRPHVLAARLSIGAAFVLAAASGSALAQGSSQPLRGPAVDSKRVPGVEDTFSGMEKGGPKNGDRGYPHKAFMDAIAKLRNDGAPADLRLTAAQEGQIKALDEEFRKEARTLADKDKGKGKNQPPAGAGAPAAPKADQNESTTAEREVRPLDVQRGRVDTFRAVGPKANEVHTKMWAVLSEPQQKFVEGELSTWRKEAEAKRGQEYMERRLKQRGLESGKPAGAAVPAKPAEAGAGRDRARRIVERLSQLPPEERDRILARLEEELDKRESGRKGKDGEKRPAPGLDGVNVPTPADDAKPSDKR